MYSLKHKEQTGIFLLKVHVNIILMSELKLVSVWAYLEVMCTSQSLFDEYILNLKALFGHTLTYSMQYFPIPLAERHILST